MKGPKIIEVIEGSCAYRAGIRAGDRLMAIEGKAINDIIDYLYLSASRSLKLELERDRKPLLLTVRKREEDILGLRFESEIFDSIKICRNRCPFCFVDQVPEGMRKTLTLKDDDFRLSFLHGNFISLTNLTDDDWQKIRSYRLSPLYVSVHTTIPSLRAQIFGHPEARNIHKQLKRLSEWGITVHTQIVLCPGINDGQALVQTVSELAQYYPSVASIAIVPVGVTRYLPKGSPVIALTVSRMKEIIKEADSWRKQCQTYFGDPLVYLGDEFYLKTGTGIPPLKYYGEFPQIENGVGMMRQFLNDYHKRKRYLSSSLTERGSVSVVTGIIASGHLAGAIEDFNRLEGLNVRLHRVKNRFWGGCVDVTGLLTGRDVIETVKKEGAGDRILIPSVCLKDDHLFLDDVSLDEIERECGAKAVPVEPTFTGLRDSLLTL